MYLSNKAYFSNTLKKFYNHCSYFIVLKPYAVTVFFVEHHSDHKRQKAYEVP